MAIIYPSGSARREAQEKILRAARALIERQDYLSLQRLHARIVSAPTFDVAVYDFFQGALSVADDASIMHAVEFSKRLREELSR